GHGRRRSSPAYCVRPGSKTKTYSTCWLTYCGPGNRNCWTSCYPRSTIPTTAKAASPTAPMRATETRHGNHRDTIRTSPSPSVWKCCCPQCNRQPLRQSSVQVDVEAKGLGQSPPGRQIQIPWLPDWLCIQLCR